MTKRQSSVSRRRVIGGMAAMAAATVPAPGLRAQRTGGRVVVRGIGGAYQDALSKSLFGPFTRDTGIEVVIQAVTAGQVRAMVAAGRTQIDVLDLGELGLLSLDKSEMLEPIDYGRFALTNPNDIDPPVRRPTMVGAFYFGTVMTYRTDVFGNTPPKNWTEFWDAGRFPGPRTLADAKAAAPELEFALLADGVPIDKLYPLDVDRAFRSFDRIRGNVVKWWDTGALVTQLLERKEAVLGAMWVARAFDLIDRGVPVGVQWNQGKRQLQLYAIVKNAPNRDNAIRFIDYAMQASVHAEIAAQIAYATTNSKARGMIPAEHTRRFQLYPDRGFTFFQQDGAWWADNVAKVSERWQSWLLGR